MRNDRFSRTLRAACVLALVALVPGACGDDGVRVGTDDAPASLAMALSVVGTAATVGEVFDKADNLFVRVEVEGQQPVVRTFDVDPAGGGVRAPIQLTLEDETAAANVLVELRRGADPLFAGAGSTVLHRGERQELQMSIAPVAATILVPGSFEVDVLGEAVQLPGEVGFATGDPLPGGSLTWSESSADIDVTPTGQLTATRNGTYTVTATSGSLQATLEVVVDAPPTTVEFVAGFEQRAPPGHPVEESPVVRVSHNGIPLEGIDVAFSADMGGTVSDLVVTTDADGLATLTTWTLGDQHGINTLTATAGGVSATLVALADACMTSTPLALGESVSGELDLTSGCPAGDQYTLTVPSMSPFDISMSADAFTPLIWTLHEGTNRLISGWTSSEPETVTVEHLLPSGQYRIWADSKLAESEPAGSYTLSTTPRSIPAEGCQTRTTVIDGSVAEGRVTFDDCVDPFNPDTTTTYRVDDYGIFVRSGATVSATLTVEAHAHFSRWAFGELAESYVLEPGETRTITFTVADTHYAAYAVVASEPIISEENDAAVNYTLKFQVSGSTASPAVAGELRGSDAPFYLEVPSEHFGSGTRQR